MTDQQTIFIIGILAGSIGLLSGIFIIYAHYLKIKRSFESRLFQAEKEWADDILEVSREELIQTKAGRELLSIIEKEQPDDIIEVPEDKVVQATKEMYGRLYNSAVYSTQWVFMTKDKARRRDLWGAFIVQDAIYSARTTFLSKMVRKLFSTLISLGFLTQIGVFAPDLEQNAESVKKRAA